MYPCRFRASRAKVEDYVSERSFNLAHRLFAYVRTHYNAYDVRMCLAGGAVANALWIVLGRHAREHDWDLFCAGSYADVLEVLMGVFEWLLQDHHASYFVFTCRAFTIVLFFNNGADCVKMSFILVALFCLGESLVLLCWFGASMW